MTDKAHRVRVADLLVEALVHAGITDTFIVTGGGAMHLNDAFARNGAMRVTYLHHEQSCAMAAESYARSSRRLAIVNVTTGPGGINALNGVYGAYTDSIGMVVISGQVKRETLASTYPDHPLRQLGDQEADIVAMVRPITKFATVVRDPALALYALQKAVWLARNGRPGPVWLDVPIDVQGALVDPAAVRRFSPDDTEAFDDVAPNSHQDRDPLLGAALDGKAAEVAALLSSAKRPVVLAGGGVRISGAHAEFLKVVEQIGAPVLTAWNSHDAIATAHPLHCGRPGTLGDRAGNFIVQSADVVLVLGCRLNIRQISYAFRAFAKSAKLVMVDVDKAELGKPTLNVALPVHADLKDFLPALCRQLAQTGYSGTRHGAFLTKAASLSARYPVVLASYRDDPGKINPYRFVERLFEVLREDDIVVTANGSACVITFQAARIKPMQRLYTNSGSASMGYDLPGAIGASVANPGRRVICLAGDGSIMMNLQELQSIVGPGRPIKVIVLNNDGYHSIRETQRNNFPDNIGGCGPESGVTFPDFCKIGAAFGFPTGRATDAAGMEQLLQDVLRDDRPYLGEVFIDKAQPFSPKLASKRMPDGTMVSPPPEDMAPFLPREELEAVMNELLADE
jgi:acetolactate synthase-1/2/3 large subunit